MVKKTEQLTGEIIANFKTEDAIGLFDGFIPNRINKNAMELSVELFSIRTVLVIKEYSFGDPVAQEILNLTESRFNMLYEECTEIKQNLNEIREKDIFSLESKIISDSPVRRDCSKFNKYGMLAVKTLSFIDLVLTELIEMNHLTLITKEEMETSRRILKKRFRGAMTPVFLYKRSAKRSDFEAMNSLAKDLIKHYRRVGHITPKDNRTDEEICEYFAYYDEKPKFI